MPHIHLHKDAQDNKYGKEPQNFKARLHFGVDYHVQQPTLPKSFFLQLVH